jgi:hypothetical protein
VVDTTSLPIKDHVDLELLSLSMLLAMTTVSYRDAVVDKDKMRMEVAVITIKEITDYIVIWKDKNPSGEPNSDRLLELERKINEMVEESRKSPEALAHMEMIDPDETPT